MEFSGIDLSFRLSQFLIINSDFLFLLRSSGSQGLAVGLVTPVFRITCEENSRGWLQFSCLFLCL